MNQDMLRQVAAAIEVEPEAFQMTLWLSPSDKTICGTIACVAGSTVMLNPKWRAKHYYPADRDNPFGFYDFDDGSMSGCAANMLGFAELPWWYEYDSDTHPLFVNNEWWRWACHEMGLDVPDRGEGTYELEWITAKHAATVLRGLADGIIDFETDPYEPYRGFDE
jgi:hypothetical protein